jgi:hypothetical protein
MCTEVVIHYPITSVDTQLSANFLSVAFFLTVYVFSEQIMERSKLGKEETDLTEKKESLFVV